MSVSEKDVMKGFNPIYGLSAEEIEADPARQGSDAPSSAAPEGDPTDPSTQGDPTGDPVAEREVTLDGRTFKTSADVAEAFTREINRRDGTRGAELQTLRERLARLEGASTRSDGDKKVDEGPPIPDPDEQIENPAKYQAEMLAYVNFQQEKNTRALAKRYEDAETRKAAEDARTAAWKEHCEVFYAKPENKILRDNKDIVDLVLNQNRQKLALLDTENGFQELSRLSRERIARLTGHAPEVKARNTPKPAHLEGSTSRAGDAAPKKGEDEGPKSLTQALKERRRRASENFGKGGVVPRAAAHSR